MQFHRKLSWKGRIAFCGTTCEYFQSFTNFILGVSLTTLQKPLYRKHFESYEKEYMSSRALLAFPEIHKISELLKLLVYLLKLSRSYTRCYLKVSHEIQLELRQKLSWSSSQVSRIKLQSKHDRSTTENWLIYSQEIIVPEVFSEVNWDYSINT